MEEIKQSLRGYLRIFFRRKWLLFIPLFSCFILSICIGIVLPRSYKSFTTILVQEGKSDNPLFSNIAVSSTMSQRTQGIREVMLGWDSLVKLVKRLNLDEKIKSSLDFEQLMSKLRKDISINFREGNIIELQYITDNPQKAKDVVENITNIFIERNVEVQNKETSDAINFIEAQLKVYRGKIKSTEIAELKDKLKELLVDSTEEHPLVKQYRDQINQKMLELKKDDLEYSEEARLGAETTNPMISEIKKTLDTITSKTPTPVEQTNESGDKDIYKVMLLDKLDNVMARDVNVNETIYNNLLQRLETAKITQRLQSSKDGTRYTILNPARVPLSPIKPNMIMVILGGIFFGLALGVGLIFVCEFLDKSFLDVQEASSFLGVPLLGAISRINTQESVLEEQERNKWIVFWMATIGILMIAFTIMVKSILKP